MSQSIDHWETIVKTGDNCKYYIPKSNIGSNWIVNDFNDNNWITALSGVGFGDNDDNTKISPGISGEENIYSNTPDWFWEPVDFNNHNLPLVIINTNGQTIPEESRIIAQMGIINNGEGQTNLELDSWNEYSGLISIERRGESSSGFKKKSYSVKLILI